MKWAYRQKHWLSDPASYPLIAILAAAGCFCTGFGVYFLGTAQDVQISPLKRWVSILFAVCMNSLPPVSLHSTHEFTLYDVLQEQNYSWLELSFTWNRQLWVGECWSAVTIRSWEGLERFHFIRLRLRFLSCMRLLSILRDWEFSSSSNSSKINKSETKEQWFAFIFSLRTHPKQGTLVTKQKEFINSRHNVNANLSHPKSNMINTTLSQPWLPHRSSS